jgi:hypothetical protein
MVDEDIVIALVKRLGLSVAATEKSSALRLPLSDDAQYQ